MLPTPGGGAEVVCWLAPRPRGGGEVGEQMMVGSPPPKGRGDGLVSTPALHRRGGASYPGGRSGGGVECWIE